MNSTSEILERINRSSMEHHDGVFTRLYRYLLREDIYYIAYQKLYANTGAVTPGVDTDTADGFGSEYIEAIISELKNGTYRPNPVRRKYIQKANGKLRPLGIPSFRDKLLQEVVRMFLQAIYEPVFYDQSHGFRPNRSCHTALSSIKFTFQGVKWFIEGDIRGCFDNINHNALIGLIERKIKDSKFINIIRMFLKAGYVEDFEYHNTLSGTPQGGIISPILANIYLHELDRKVAEIKSDFDAPPSRAMSKEYQHYFSEMRRTKKKIVSCQDSERPGLIKQYKELRKHEMSCSRKPEDDKKLVYCRYADDFLIGVCGNKEDCERIKGTLKDFLGSVYSLELSEEKTKITHSASRVRFLGYDISVRKNQQIRRRKDGRKARSLFNTVELLIPVEDKLNAYLIKSGMVRQTSNGNLSAVAIRSMTHLSDIEIVRSYDTRLRGICNYYRLAANYNDLCYFRYLLQTSMYRTLARKHNTTMMDIANKYKTRNGWALPYDTKRGRKYAALTEIAACKKSHTVSDTAPWKYSLVPDYRLSLKKRLMAQTCELCGTHCSKCKVFHAGSMKEIAKETAWGQKMLGIRRKTLVVCNDCYSVIHSNKSKVLSTASREPDTLKDVSPVRKGSQINLPS